MKVRKLVWDDYHVVDDEIARRLDEARRIAANIAKLPGLLGKSRTGP